MFICLPILDVSDFVSSVDHKIRFLTQTVAVCQSYNNININNIIMSVNGTQGFEKQTKNKLYTGKSKLNPEARDDTLRY